MIFLLVFLNILLDSLVLSSTDAYKVIYAINAGGDEHQGSDGIFYQKDPLPVGTASDYGKNLLMIGRVPEQDEILYQTERYHTNTFGYDLPATLDGEYVLVLKFCEVYFNAPNQKVFDVILNGDHTVVADLDIFSLVGRGTAHDEYIYFSISRGKLYYKEEESEIRGGKIRIEFIKGYRDNPKINAIALIKGDVENIPKLAPLNTESSTETYQESTGGSEEILASEKASTTKDQQPSAQQQQQQNNNKVRKTSGPKQPNPYTLDESSMMLPIFVALGLFIPLLFCLCKL